MLKVRGNLLLQNYKNKLGKTASLMILIDGCSINWMHIQTKFISHTIIENRDHRIEKFKPDFIFWLKKGDKYHIIFEDGQDRKTFTKNGLKIQVHLKLYTEEKNKLSEGCKAYWSDNPKDIIDGICVITQDAIASYYLAGFRTLRTLRVLASLRSVIQSYNKLTSGYAVRYAHQNARLCPTL